MKPRHDIPGGYDCQDFELIIKKVLEITESYRQLEGSRGDKDEAYDAKAASGCGQGGKPVSTQREEGERLSSGGAGGDTQRAPYQAS